MNCFQLLVLKNYNLLKVNKCYGLLKIEMKSPQDKIIVYMNLKLICANSSVHVIHMTHSGLYQQ